MTPWLRTGERDRGGKAGGVRLSMLTVDDKQKVVRREKRDLAPMTRSLITVEF